MRTMILLSAIGLFCVAGPIPGGVQAQEKKATEPAKQPSKAEKDEMMKKWMEVSSPGEAHKRLNDLVGTWTTESRIWMEGPGSQPTLTKGMAEYKWILGGRFLQQDLQGEMMGMPMTGIGFTGYDNFNKKYIGTWIDDSGTAMYTMEGTADQTGKVITLYGKMDESMTGERDKTVKYVFRILDKDKHVFEIHDLSIGEASTKVVEMTYTRKK